jgi:two-component system cell cycle sensor histidine kinase/response regulator CckA
VLRLLGAALPVRGFAVWLADGSDEALDLYRRHRDDIGVVLLDVLMPGLDGPATLAALRRENPELRHLFMSAYPGEHCGQLEGWDGADLLVKPFELSLVVAALLRVLA